MKNCCSNRRVFENALFHEYFHGDTGRGLGPVIKPDGRLWSRGYREIRVRNARAMGSTDVSISAQQYVPDVTYPRGYEYLQSFTEEPWPE